MSDPMAILQDITCVHSLMCSYPQASSTNVFRLMYKWVCAEKNCRYAFNLTMRVRNRLQVVALSHVVLTK